MPIAVGIDIGNRNITVAVVRRKGIDIVVNDVSNRQTPTFVSFGEKERGIGEAGFSLYLRNIRNTVTDLKRLIGRQYDDKDVQFEISKLSYNTVKLEDGSVGMKTWVNGEEKTFRMEQILAMLLLKIKEFTEEYCKDKMCECVISCPGYFTENQRRAILNASEISGIKCLRLMNEHAATGVAYGLYKTDLSETEARPVCIIDVGHSATTCSVINFTKSKMKVVAVEYNTQIGGRNYDEIVAQEVRKDIQAKWKIDPITNPRMWNRILAGIEKSVKRVISSGSPKAVLNLDTLYEERDYRKEFTREEFEKLTEPMNAEVIAVMQRAIQNSGVGLENLHSIEITGSGTRLTSLQESITKAFGKQLSKTINCEESIARGCSIACAQLTPYFKVRDYAVEDIPPYEATMAFVSDKKEVQPMKFIGKDTAFPITRVVRMKDIKQLHVDCNYRLDNNALGGTFDKGITIDVVEMPKPKTDKTELKLRIAMTNSGILEMVDCNLCEEVEEEVEEKETIMVEEEIKEEEKKEEKKEEPKPAEAPKEGEQPAETKMEEDKPAEAPKEGEQKPAEEKKEEQKPKTRKVKKTITKKVKKMVNKEYPIKTTVAKTGLPEGIIKACYDEEKKMQEIDRNFIETANAKNDLEAWIYSMKDKLSTDGELSEFTTLVESMKLCAELEKFIDWLYDEGEDVSKADYCDKLAEAQKVVKHITDKKAEKDRKIAEEKRRKEEEERKKKEEEERKKKEEEEKKKKEEEEKKKKEEEAKKAAEGATAPAETKMEEDNANPTSEPPPVPQ